MTKQNLTEYGSGELSMMVFNDESLYLYRHSRNLWDVLDELFIYTQEQKEELEQDLIDDAGEE